MRVSSVLEGIVAVAIHDAEEWKQHTTPMAAESWAEYVRRQLKNGAGSAHRLVKRDDFKPFDFTTLRMGPNITARASDILDDDFHKWRAEWTRLGAAPSAPWRQAAITANSPPITADGVPRTAGSFKASTSIGTDCFPPKAMHRLSTPFPGAIASFLRAAEAEGRWPEAASDVLMHPQAVWGTQANFGACNSGQDLETSSQTSGKGWALRNHKKYDRVAQGRLQRPLLGPNPCTTRLQHRQD